MGQVVVVNLFAIRIWSNAEVTAIFIELWQCASVLIFIRSIDDVFTFNMHRF